METETLSSYVQNQDKHIGGGTLDVVSNDSSQNKSICQEDAESIDSTNNQRQLLHSEEIKDDQSKVVSNESDEESRRIENESSHHESDEECEEEEKLVLSPTHSDKEFDTDEDRDLSADEVDSDEVGDEDCPKDKSEISDINDGIEANDSAMHDKTEELSNEDEDAEKNNSGDEGEKLLTSDETEKEDDTVRANENEINHSIANCESEIVPDPLTDKHTEDPVAEDETETKKALPNAEETDGKKEEANENDSTLPSLSSTECTESPGGNNALDENKKTEEDGSIEAEGSRINDDTIKDGPKEVVDAENSRVNDDTIKDGPKEVVDAENSRVNDDNIKDGPKEVVEAENSRVNDDSIKDGPKDDDNGIAESNVNEDTAPECSLLKETLTKPSNKDTSRGEGNGDEDVDMDEDFDPSLLCPELSMEVDEAPVITSTDPPALDNESNKSMLLYEPIFSTFVDEITGAEVNFQLTEEEQKLKEETYGAQNPVEFTKIHCTACNVHLGSALNGQGNRFVHPLLKVLICKKCYHFYTSGEFEKDEDGSELYCRWCGQGGQVMCCSKCEMVFCKKCIRINFDRKKIAAIRDSDDWLCFRCNPSQLMHLRIHCSEFMDYVQRDLSRAMSHEDPTAAMTTDYTRCCTQQKKKATETPVGESKRKRKRLNQEQEDPDYDPRKHSQSPPLLYPEIPLPPLVLRTAATNKAVTPVVKAVESTKSKGTAQPTQNTIRQRFANVPVANRAVAPGQQLRPKVLNHTLGVRSTTTPGFIKILPVGVRAPGTAPIRPPLRPPALRPIQPNTNQTKNEWFEKTVRAAARVNSNLSYTLTQLNRAQSSATSVEALAIVHNKLQEILSTSINSLIQIRKNLRTEFIAGIKNIRFPPKSQPTQQATSSAQDDDVIFVSPTTSPVPPPIPATTSAVTAMNLPPSISLIKKSSNTSPNTSANSRANSISYSKPGPSGISKPGSSNTSKPGPSITIKQGPGNVQPRSFLRVKSLLALQNVTSECITIPDDPSPTSSENTKEPASKAGDEGADDDDDDDDVTVIEKKVEIVTIIEDSPIKSLDEKDEPEAVSEEDENKAKKDQDESTGEQEKVCSNGLTNGNDEGDEKKFVDDGTKQIFIDQLDPVEKMKILNPKILLLRSSEIDELVRSKFALLNGDT